MNQEQLKKDFPILSRDQNGFPLTYLDSANTSLTPEPVLEAMNRYYREYNANIHRGIYPISEKATQEHESAREKIARFLHANSSKEIVFTRNATEAINLVVQTWGRTRLNKDDGILLSVMEHHSNIVPWQMLQKEIGFKIHFLDLGSDGKIDQEQFKNYLKNENIKMVSIIHQSNTIGTINPVKEMVQHARDYGAATLVDGAQSAAHLPINLKEMDPDFFVCTGHKMCGPTGIGVLAAKESWLEDLPPFLGGGEMIASVSKDRSTWNTIPYKFEAGTPNIAGAIGLGAAIDYLQNIGMENIHQHEQQLLSELLEKLKTVTGISIYGPQSLTDRGATVSFSLEGVHPHDIATILGERGVCVRAGNHCAQPLMEYFGVPATTRISLAFYNNSDDVDRCIEAVKNVQQVFQ